ncbi:AAA family ATPase [bacterium]|nr:AAA family ATPase [bacterium]
MLKSIKIKGYKSFKDVTIELQRLTVILGPNASGKSNFLDAISLFSKFISKKSVNEAFKEHRGFPSESFFYGDIGLEKLLQEESRKMCFEAIVEISENTKNEIDRIIEQKTGLNGAKSRKKINWMPYLKYTIELEAFPQKNFLIQVRDERLEALNKNLSVKSVKSKKPFISKIRRENREEVFSVSIEGQSHPKYYPLGLDRTVISENFYEPYYRHISAFKREVENWMIFYLEPRKLMRRESPPHHTFEIGENGEQLACFLKTLLDEYPRSFETLVRGIKQILPSDPELRVELDKRKGIVEFLLNEMGIDYSSRLISEGTLRVIGLLAALHPKNSSTVIAYEEPENGIHPVRISQIADIIKGVSESKQIIITTHSPYFAEQFDYENLFVSYKEGPSSGIKPIEKYYGPLFKKKMIETSLSDLMLRGDFGG